MKCPRCKKPTEDHSNRAVLCSGCAGTERGADEAPVCPECNSEAVNARHEGHTSGDEVHIPCDCWTCGAFFYDVRDAP